MRTLTSQAPPPRVRAARTERLALGRKATVAAAILASVGWSVQSGAAPCGRPDLQETLPLDGANGVALNVMPAALYPPAAEYDDEPVLFGSDPDDLAPMVAVYNENEGILSFAPPEPLSANVRYWTQWPELRGFGSATRGRGGRVEFTTGDQLDAENPVFAGVRTVAYDLERERDECTDRVEDRFVFDLALGPAEDDGGRHSLSIVVLQTSGPNVRKPTPVLTAPYPDDGRLRVRLPVADSVGRICFAAIARDLRLGSVPAGGNARACVDTVEPPFFYGCSSAPGQKNVNLLWALGACVVYGMRRSRRMLQSV